MSKIRVCDGFYKANAEMVAAALCFVYIIRHFVRALKTLCQCNNSVMHSVFVGTSKDLNNSR